MQMYLQGISFCSEIFYFMVFLQHASYAVGDGNFCSVMINKTHWPKRDPFDIAVVNVLHHNLVVNCCQTA